MKLLLGFLLASFALPLNAGTVEEKFVPLYYQEIKKADFSAAKNVLKNCKYGNNCDHFKVMHETLLHAMSQKDVIGTRWICAEIKQEEEDREVVERVKTGLLIAALGVGTIVTIAGISRAVSQ